MGKLPYEKKRAILQYLDSAILQDVKGNFLRKKEWLNPNQIQAGLKNMGMGTVGRDEIRIFLDECYEHEKKYVDRRKPDRNDPDSVTKAQNEYALMDSGKELLQLMMNPNMEFINKKIK